ncbi:fructose-2 [Schizosaccharomyces osmophilus]|uniref:fructose-2,6-bisphosphate 2-phosphatase n=1 Tax=Schizosaccharomyces osmophilus TaxID=2545709 RepID=A0AAE9WEQ4_9SCHI|nr:fructose-2 [Schizosaccharomyces osmophilus]WBW73388.1 fructose-2 [Schizosaccharomyces osmophilus]
MEHIEGYIGLCVCFLGLPASGKTFSAGKLSRYFSWMSVKTEVYSSEKYLETEYESSDLVPPRHTLNQVDLIFNDLETFYKEDGHVTILDFNECHKELRQNIVNAAEKRKILVMFVEIVCTDHKFIEENITDICTNSPSYKHIPLESAKKKLREVIKSYRQDYAPLTEAEDCTFVRIIDFGNEVIIHNIENYWQSRIVYYLSNLRTKRRSIWLSRHGESEFNVQGRIGGNSGLSSQGEKYASLLPEYVSKFVVGSKGLTVWTSSMKRTIQTASHLDYQKLEWKALDELDAGIFDGFTYDYIEEKYPHEAQKRSYDKFHYRYRGGESYMDVVRRLEPIIMELERQGDVFIICHQAILRCIYGYYHNFSLEELPFLNVPLHTILKLTPTTFETLEERLSIPVSAVSTQRGK